MDNGEGVEAESTLATEVNNGAVVDKNLPKTTCFERRQYQVELIQLALRENVILVLPTGSGKTFIALKVIERTIAENYGTGKKVIFLACTVPLVKQQAGFLRDHLPPECTVHALVGDMGTDFYNPVEWANLLATASVFVMTPDILHRALLHGNISWDQVSLLVLDECHNATGEQAYVKIMTSYMQHKVKESVSNVPRVLGLTATIVKGTVKVKNIEKEIEGIQNRLFCRAVTHPNFEEILKFSTKANVNHVKLTAAKWSAEGGILTDLQRLISQLESKDKCSGDSQKAETAKNLNLPSGTEFFNRKKPIITKLGALLSDFIRLYTELGPYCSKIAASVKEYAVKKYIDEIETLNHSKTTTSVVLYAAMTDLIQFQRNVTKFMNQEYKRKATSHTNKQEFQVKHFNSERTDALLKILLNRNAAYTEGTGEPPCGLVFCDQRITAQVLAWFLQSLAKDSPEYNFLKVDFILGSSAKLDLEAGRLASNWQSNVLTRFRNKELNLIVATSVLEEGLDVSSCNFVVRFNPVQNYPSYIQSMGRARMKNAQFYILTADHEFETQRQKIEEYQTFNQQLAVILAKKLGSDEEEEMPLDKLTPQSCISTFCPGGNVDSPIIPESEAIPAVFRYCSLLKSDGLSKPEPVSWCIPTANGSFKASLLLPCNTPITDVIEGEPCSTKVLAKQSVFCKACTLLYKAGELTDALLPRNQEDEFESKFLNDLAQESKSRNKGGSKLGTKKNTENYEKLRPLHHFGKPITASQLVYIYQVQLKYEAFETMQQTSLNYYYDFERHPYSFGFLTSLQSISNLPTFSMRVNTGRIKVTLVQRGDQFTMSRTDLNKVAQFQAFMAKYVYAVPQMEMLKQKSEDELLIVPLKKDGSNSIIDWKKMEELQDFHWEQYNVLPSDEEKENFKFTLSSYSDAVVVPCHRPLGKNDPNKMYCVTEVSETTNADSCFPFKKSGGHLTRIRLTYAAHYLKNCNTKIVNTQLPILVCRVVGKQRNFLWCEKSKKSLNSGTCFEFPPEVVRVSPLPACFLLQGRYIPSILHRINRLTLASSLQQLVGSQYNWNVSRNGTDKEHFKVTEAAGAEPGDWNTVDKQGFNSRSRDCAKITKMMLEQSSQGIHFIHPEERTWSQINVSIKHENSFRTKGKDSGSPRYSSSNAKKKRLPERYPVRIVTKGLISSDSINFPSFDAKTDFDQVKGPNVFQVMEALTLAHANDYLNLERLEIIGDSVLKLVVSTHLFSSFPTWKEGKLSKIRTRLVSNEHLCAVALRRNVGRLLAGGIFEIQEWTPPGFQVSCEEATTISDKSIADATEALIGAYYLEGGLDSAFRLMEWIGLRGPRCVNRESVDEPYSREISFSRPELKYSPGKKSPKQLVPYLNEVEKILDYTFENEWLLVEALTHSTYMNNRVTQSYQRLEFLGDAVLDFLITHYIIKSTNIANPGRVTDLRSALVNNVTFGCISERFTFPLYLLHASDLLHDKIASFSEIQRQRNYDLTDPYMLSTDEETSLPQNVDIPKALGDMFEAITGAIYVDSNYSLDKVWRVVYRLMKREIDSFSKNIPINPVRKVMEMFPNKVKLVDVPLQNCSHNLVCVQITIDGATKIEAQGVGTRKKFAKEAAAKLILKKISSQQRL